VSHFVDFRLMQPGAVSSISVAFGCIWLHGTENPS
jgi:hypothetical protein